MLGKLVLIVAVLIIPLIPTFWAILDVPRRRFSTTRSKVIWFAVVSTLPCIGAIFYLLMGRRNTQPL
jgi:hypothetical protein